jgi:alpha-tubulin suppressor-like RCC1 family protein
MYSLLSSLFFLEPPGRKQISAGYAHTMFRTEKGEVYACGCGRFGQLGTGDRENRLTPVKITFPEGTDPIKEISAGGAYTMFLTEKGEVYACGWGGYGQLGTGDNENLLTPVKITSFPPGTSPIKEISTGDDHTVFLTQTGEVYACGWGGYGQLGTGDRENHLTPVKITSFPVGTDPIKKISASGFRTVFLTQTGEVYACGLGGRGQLGTGYRENRLTPVKITTFPVGTDPIKEISAGGSHTMFLTEKGEVYACGLGEDGQLGTGDNENHLTPVKITTFPVGTDPIKEISTGYAHTMFLIETGEVYACGWGGLGKLGTGDDQSRLTPVNITTFPAGVDPIKEISAGDAHTIFLSETGEVYACGSGDSGRLGTGDNKKCLTPVKINLRLSTE